MESAFMDKSHQPTQEELKNTLGNSYSIWEGLRTYLNEILKVPGEEWNFPGKKYGWSFRMKSKKRNIIYFLPREGFFKVAFVFGDKAVAEIDKSSVSEFIKKELSEARKYAEGRGIRIDVKDNAIINDIKELIFIKLEN